MIVLGLDISTTYTGVSVIDKELNIKLLEHIDFKKCNTVWEKADRVKTYFEDLQFDNIERIFVEDPAKKFSMGASSAGTIVTLARFNGLVSYLARARWNIDPEYLAPSQARKLCGLKMQQKKVCNKSHKEQTFDAMMATDLKHIVWPNKKNSKNIVDWAYDRVDAYVISKAGVLLNS